MLNKNSNDMSIDEVITAIKLYEKKVMGKKLGDAGHIIQGFGIDLIKGIIFNSNRDNAHSM